MPVPLVWGESGGGDEVSRSEALTLDKDTTTAKEANNGTTSENDAENTTARAEPLNSRGFHPGPPPPIPTAKEANNSTTSENDADNTTARAEPLNSGGFDPGPPPPTAVAVASVTSMLTFVFSMNVI